MGGRGSADRSTGRSGAVKSSAAERIQKTNTKFTSSQLISMLKSNLVVADRAVFIKQNMARGLSAKEADYRARSLMSSNSDAQLRN